MSKQSSIIFIFVLLFFFNYSVQTKTTTIDKNPFELSNLIEVPTRECLPPYKILETSEMRSNRILIFIVFGIVFLALKFGLETLSYKNNPFFVKSIKALFQHMSLYFICIMFLVFLQVQNTFSAFNVNIDMFIQGLAIFGIVWVIFGLIFISLVNKQISKWRLYEKEIKSENSYEEDTIYNNNQSSDEEVMEKKREILEYKLLKMNFISPLFPSFKPILLKEKFDFARYLDICLQNEVSKFLNFSLICVLVSLFFIFLWNFFTSSMSPLGAPLITIILVFPIIILLFLLLIFVIIKSVYNKSVTSVTKDNYTILNISSDKIEMDQETANELNIHDNYIKKIFSQKDKSLTSKWTLHEHIFNSPPNYYEELMIGGRAGFTLIPLLIQTFSVIFFIWCIALYTKHASGMITALSYYFLLFVIPLSIAYSICLFFIIEKIFKYHTIISSVILI